MRACGGVCVHLPCTHTSARVLFPLVKFFLNYLSLSIFSLNVLISFSFFGPVDHLWIPGCSRCFVCADRHGDHE